MFVKVCNGEEREQHFDIRSNMMYYFKGRRHLTFGLEWEVVGDFSSTFDSIKLEIRREE